jgi:hypothetical protein
MSTVHICYTNIAAEVALVEHSGKLDLSVDDGLGNGVDINDLTPDQVARMATKMLLAAHYQDEEAVANAARESRERYAMRISL